MSKIAETRLKYIIDPNKPVGQEIVVMIIVINPFCNIGSILTKMIEIYMVLSLKRAALQS